MAPSARCDSIDTVRSAGPANASADEAKVRQSGLPPSRAVEADQAVGKLVLDRLELADELPELLSDFGMLDGHFE
jgi:hypothetical protein